MRFSGFAYDPLGSLTFLLIKNVIYMAIHPPSSPGLATPTYSTACFFAPPYVALATALDFQMCKNPLNMMWNVQLFRMRPITAILVHWFKRYWFLVAPVSDRNTGEGYITYNRWRIQGEFRAVGPPKTQSGLLTPPPPNGWSMWVFYSFRCFFFFFTDMNIAISLWYCQIVYFWRFFRIKISKFSSRSQNLSEIGYWRIQDPLKTKFHTLKTHIFLLHQKISTSVIFFLMILGGGLFVCWGLRARRRPGQFAPPGRWKVGHFVSYICFWKWIRVPQLQKLA